MDCSTPGFPVLHHLPELAQTHFHGVSDAIQPSCPLLKGTTEEEMVEWHHCLNGHELEQALGDGEGQGSLVLCSP